MHKTHISIDKERENIWVYCDKLWRCKYRNMKDGGHGNCAWQELAEYDDQVADTIFVINFEERKYMDMENMEIVPGRSMMSHH